MPGSIPRQCVLGSKRRRVPARNWASPPDRYLFPVNQAERGCAGSLRPAGLSLALCGIWRYSCLALLGCPSLEGFL
jgi:hypothetical protein